MWDQSKAKRHRLVLLSTAQGGSVHNSGHPRMRSTWQGPYKVAEGSEAAGEGSHPRGVAALHHNALDEKWELQGPFEFEATKCF